jgi:tyrosine-protein kinase Etk/Wzc
MEETSKIQQKLPNQEFDYFKMAKILVSRWYWIAGMALACYIAADVYLWYTPKTYSTTASLKLEENKTEISEIVGVTGTSTDKGFSRIQSETFVMQSRRLIINAVKDLGYPINFYIEGRVRTNSFELYPQKPLQIKIVKFDSLRFDSGIITFKPIDQTTFSLSYKNERGDIKRDFRFGDPVSIDSTSFSIAYVPGIEKSPMYMFKFNNPDGLANRVLAGLQISELIKNSNIISLRETDANPQFAANILNAIMKEYLVYDHEKKQLSASQIISFIDKQLDTISGKVKSSEKAIENFKRSSKLIDVNTAAQAQLGKSTESEAQRALLKIQLNTIQEARKNILSGNNNATFNFSLEGSQDQAITTQINTYNTLMSNRNVLLKSYNAKSSPIQDIDRQLIQFKSALVENLDFSAKAMQNRISAYDKQLEAGDQKMATMPAAERELVSLNRDLEISEKVYNLLSEKKLDAQISRSAIAPGATIIEQAQPNFTPVAPDEHSIRRTALISGLILGLGLIILIRVLNPYIYDKETVESLTTIPIIGVIRKFNHKLDENSSGILVLSQPKSIFAESVRSVRTNLSFLAAEKQNKVICVTSEVAGEGKSFVSINLSSTLSLIDKKVVLIAADLRRSKLHETFHVANDTGLSNYLANQVALDDIILTTSQENLDFIASGPVPPNPSELLHNERMKTLIEDLSLRYDFVMIDTAPVGLVSDSIPLIRLSDINVFVIRSGKSKFYAATIPQRIDSEYNLNNSVIILNAFEEDLLHSRYYNTKFTGNNTGNRYYYYSDFVGYESSGYYVDDNKRKWWDPRSWFK